MNSENGTEWNAKRHLKMPSDYNQYVPETTVSFPVSPLKFAPLEFIRLVIFGFPLGLEINMR